MYTNLLTSYKGIKKRMGKWLKVEMGQGRNFGVLKIRGITVHLYVCRKVLREKTDDAGESMDNCWKNVLE